MEKIKQYSALTINSGDWRMVQTGHAENLALKDKPMKTSQVVSQPTNVITAALLYFLGSLFTAQQLLPSDVTSVKL